MLYMDRSGRVRQVGTGRYGRIEDYLLQLMEQAMEEEARGFEGPDEGEDLGDFPDYELSPGAEVEWTVTYTPPRGRKYAHRRETLHLKLRVRVDRKMTSHTAMRLVERAGESGMVPPSISLRWVDWGKGVEGHAYAGRGMGSKAHRALRDFLSVLSSPVAETRFSLVREV